MALVVDQEMSDLALTQDRDSDGVPDALDNCPSHANPDQRDGDRDGAGDLCDPDCFGAPVACQPAVRFRLAGETFRGVEESVAPQRQPELFIEVEGYGVSTLSDLQARYVIPRLPRGEHLTYLYLRRAPPPAGSAPQRAYSLERPDGLQRLSLVADRSLDLVAAPRASLSGVVRLEGVEAFEHGGVGIFIASRPGHQTLSAPDGSFTIENIPLPLEDEAPLTLELRREDYAPLSVPLTALRPFTNTPLVATEERPYFLLSQAEEAPPPFEVSGEVLLPPGASQVSAELFWVAPLTGEEGQIALIPSEGGEEKAEDAEGGAPGGGGQKNDAEREIAASENARIAALRFAERFPAHLMIDLYLELPDYHHTRRRQLFTRGGEVPAPVLFSPMGRWRRLEDGRLIEDINGDGIDDAEQREREDFDGDLDGVPDDKELGWERSPFGSRDDDGDRRADAYDARREGAAQGRLEERLAGQDGAVRREELPCGERCPAIEWILIEGGSFWMGSPADSEAANEQPQRLVDVARFEIMKSEITVAHYRLCVAAGRCDAPECDGQEQCNYALGLETHAVNYVTWRELRDFGEWLGADLPTEAQWEFAARSRGRDDFIYPWGDVDPSCAHVDNAQYGCDEVMSPVCSHALGHSVQGVCDFAGGVYELMLDEYVDNYVDAAADERARCSRANCDGEAFTRVSRGGAWHNMCTNCLRVAFRQGMDPQLRANFLGGRLVRNPAP